MLTDLITRDLKHIWHPCSQMKDYELFKPLEVVKAEGAYIELKNGKKIIDAISSWWCKTLGHQHPRLKAALQRQMDQFEHVIFANTTNATIVTLSEKLAKLSPALNKVFYAGDGSSAVEIALKMSLHARQLEGTPHRNQIYALSNSYHGETLGALSVSDLGLYRKPYQSLLFQPGRITPPYVSGPNDPLWHNSQPYWDNIEKTLTPLSNTITAIIIEPIVQGAGGMKIYSPDFLKRLRTFTQQHNIHLIADEIMTGLGRTGKLLACHHANIEPDFLCLSKSLTAGWLPFSAVLTRQSIYDLFYDDYHTSKSFLHSHTYSGNPLAASIANEVLTIIEQENLCTRANEIGQYMLNAMQAINTQTQSLTNIRQLGAIVAADLTIEHPSQRAGYQLYRKATELGALLRPLGNTIYWLPPLNIKYQTLDELTSITLQALRGLLAGK